MLVLKIFINKNLIIVILVAVFLHSVLYIKLVIHRSRTIILPVVFYGCENWSLTLRAERRLGVFENRVLRRIFGPKRDEVTGAWKNYIMRS
jgi:hypothetical protein